MKSFKLFLNKQIKYLDGLETIWFNLDCPSETTEYMIQETADRAAKLGLAELYKKSLNLKGTFSDCKWYLAECVSSIKSEKYLDSKQACDYLGITESSLYGLVERKRITPLRGPRRSYRFTKQQLDNYLANNS